MLYINALELINLAVINKILKEIKGKILVYRNYTSGSKKGWYLTEKDTVAKELMKDKKGQKTLILSLQEKNVDFIPTNYLGLSKFNDNL